MGKLLRFLLIAIAAGVVLFILRQSLTRRKSRRSSPAAIQVMVQCHHCGIHLPAPEALLFRNKTYCSAAHRDADGS